MKGRGRLLTELDVGCWDEPDDTSLLRLPPAFVRAVNDGKRIAFLERVLFLRRRRVGEESGSGLSCQVGATLVELTRLFGLLEAHP